MAHDVPVFSNDSIIIAKNGHRITRMFCEHQTYANFARVDQFALQSKIIVNTDDPCQNAIVT